MWLIKNRESHQMNSYNLAKEGDSHQLWISCTNGKSKKVFESKVLADVEEVKAMLDYAVKQGFQSVEI